MGRSELKISWVTFVSIVLCVAHFPALFARLIFYLGGDTYILELLVVGGPVWALAAAVYVQLRRDWFEGLLNTLVLVAYLGMYLLIWLAAGRPVITIG